MTDIANVTGLTPEQEEAVHTPAQPEPNTEDIPTVTVPAPAEPKKRKRRTKAEMEAARAAEAAQPEPDTYQNMLGATVKQLEDLDTETPEDEIGYRPANFKDPTGKQLAYIDARYVMDVLDDTVGPAAWSSAYSVVEMGQEWGIECTITIAMRDGGYAHKTDVGVASSIEKLKGAYSDAFKRAAVHFGIARDLYDERMAEAPAPVVAAAPVAAPVQGTIAAQTAAPVAQAVPVSDPATVVEAWTCPIHGEGRIQPGGVSRRTGKAYSAFWVCTERDCDQTGGNA